MGQEFERKPFLRNPWKILSKNVLDTFAFQRSHCLVEEELGAEGGQSATGAIQMPGISRTGGAGSAVAPEGTWRVPGHRGFMSGSTSLLGGFSRHWAVA